MKGLLLVMDCFANTACTWLPLVALVGWDMSMSMSCIASHLFTPHFEDKNMLMVLTLSSYINFMPHFFFSFFFPFFSSLAHVVCDGGHVHLKEGKCHN